MTVDAILFLLQSLADGAARTCAGIPCHIPCCEAAMHIRAATAPSRVRAESCLLNHMQMYCQAPGEACA